MSKKKREAIELGLGQNRNAGCQPASKNSIKTETSFWQSLGKMERFFGVTIVALLSLSVFGFVGSKISSSFSSRNIATTENGGISSPNTLTPNTLNPVTTTTTPVLSKEYIYAGSRMLAVEDANANAAPPADLAVWRPSSGTWYVLGGVAGSAQTFAQWGISSDIPVPGDFDGDGKTDFSIYRPSSGTWWIVPSTTPNNSIALQFGASCTPPNGCDKVAPADYDGDGKTDAAVFRPSNGTWYFLLSGSGNSFYAQQFGLATDIPAPADYDGDGKADIGVWRDSNKTFYSNNSSNSQLTTATFTTNSTQPISGDYDGDGRADYAIRNGNNWTIKNSSNNQTNTITWQTSADISVQNDYDGDGKVDIATWNNANGNWFIRQSTKIGQATELRQVAWGMTGDIPVPAYYRR
jgi:FG-GAP-like repeat